MKKNKQSSETKNEVIDKNENINNNENLIIEDNNSSNSKKELKNINKKDKEFNPYNKGYYIGLIITFIILGLLSLCVYFYEIYVLNVTNINKNLTDSFFIPSIISILFYLLSVVTKNGAFDIIAYSIKLVFYSVFYSNIRKSKLPASYKEYKEIKRGSKRTSTSFLFFSAIPYLSISIIFYILYKTIV